jgi:hypothetical protein
MSAVATTTDSSRTSRHVRKVPTTDVWTPAPTSAGEPKENCPKAAPNSNLMIVVSWPQRWTSVASGKAGALINDARRAVSYA